MNAESKDVKILVLIITSDDNPVYIELQKIWRSYMHYDREHVEVYFIRGNPTLETETLIQYDTIWSRSHENIIPGMINKTMLSLEAMLPRLHEFDYVLRTNLSSFYVFPRLLNFLQTCPRSNFYCGSHIGDGMTGSGCGFLMSNDVAQALVTHKDQLMNNPHYDDVIVGRVLRDLGYRLTLHDRMDFYALQTWELHKNNIPQHAFQFRVKNSNNDLRLQDDTYIHTQLRNIFYPVMK